MSNLFSFNIPEIEKEVIEYINNLKENRELSNKILNLMKKEMNNSRNINKLREELKNKSKQYNQEIQEINKNIILNEKKAKNEFEDCIKRLKLYYSDKINNPIDVDKVITYHSTRINLITGEDIEKIKDKITKEIVKWKK